MRAPRKGREKGRRPAVYLFDRPRFPFIVTGLALSKALTAFGWIKRHYSLYKIIVGGTLIIVGILMVTNNLYYLNILGQRALDWAGIDFWKSF